LLNDNPSLQLATATLVEEAMKIGPRLAQAALEEYGEVPLVDPQRLTYTRDQILGEWFPDEPQ
jgi:hypothetical protein